GVTAIGMVAGTAAAAAAGRAMRTLLFDVSPADPLTYAAVLTLFAILAGAAVIVPARRALRVHPLVALRAGCAGAADRAALHRALVAAGRRGVAGHARQQPPDLDQPARRISASLHDSRCARLHPRDPLADAGNHLRDRGERRGGRQHWLRAAS